MRVSIVIPFLLIPLVHTAPIPSSPHSAAFSFGDHGPNRMAKRFLFDTMESLISKAKRSNSWNYFTGSTLEGIDKRACPHIREVDGEKRCIGNKERREEGEEDQTFLGGSSKEEKRDENERRATLDDDAPDPCYTCDRLKARWLKPIVEPARRLASVARSAWTIVSFQHGEDQVEDGAYETCVRRRNTAYSQGQEEDGVITVEEREAEVTPNDLLDPTIHREKNSLLTAVHSREAARRAAVEDDSCCNFYSRSEGT